MVTDGVVSLAKFLEPTLCAADLRERRGRCDRRIFSLSGIPLRRVSLEPYLAPYGYLAVNEIESGDAFGQECGLKVTIKGKSETAPARLPSP